MADLPRLAERHGDAAFAAGAPAQALLRPARRARSPRRAAAGVPRADGGRAALFRSGRAKEPRGRGRLLLQPDGVVRARPGSRSPPLGRPCHSGAGGEMRRSHAVAAALAGSALLATAAAAGPAKIIHPECVKPADHARTLFFRMSDKVRLAGVLLGKGTKGVTLAHQSRGDLCIWMPFARLLARAGYLVLPFDFRGYGRSGNGNRPDFPADVAA